MGSGGKKKIMKEKTTSKLKLGYCISALILAFVLVPLVFRESGGNIIWGVPTIVVFAMSILLYAFIFDRDSL